MKLTSSMGEPAWREAVRELDGAYAPQTLKMLIEHFGWFEAWCAARDLCALPAEPAAVAA